MAVVDEDFWAHVDDVFGELEDEIGEFENNLFWIQRPSVDTERKLVWQAHGHLRHVARGLRALLSEEASVFAGAKIMVSDDILAIAYVKSGADLPHDFLVEIAEVGSAVAPFVPHNAIVDEAHVIWEGWSHEAESRCVPVL